MYRRHFLPSTERAATRAPVEQQEPSTQAVHRAQTSSELSDESYTPSTLYYVVIHLLHNPPVKGQDYSWLPQSQRTQLYNVFLELSNEGEKKNIFVYIAKHINGDQVDLPDMTDWNDFIKDKFDQGYANTVNTVVRTLHPMPIRAAGKSKRKHRKVKKTYRR